MVNIGLRVRKSHYAKLGSVIEVMLCSSSPGMNCYNHELIAGEIS
jgi:hypothetical protein